MWEWHVRERCYFLQARFGLRPVSFQLKWRTRIGPKAGARGTVYPPSKGEDTMIVLRSVIGNELRRERLEQGRTLREVSSQARVSLGYLSEVERGQKEASSELLAAICGALDVPLSTVLHSVSTRVADHEAFEIKRNETKLSVTSAA